MYKLSFFKWGCLAFVMLFGLVAGVDMEGASADFAVTKDGCYVLEAGPGGFNAGPPTDYSYTSAAGCDAEVPAASLNVDAGNITVVNDNSSVVLNNPPANSFIGTFTGAYTAVGITPINPSWFTSIFTPVYCKDFYGITNDNPVKGIGVIDFDNVAPDGDYRVCLDRYLSNVPAGELHFSVDGWGWNTNIGWFATMAEDLGSGPVNRGLSVGSVEFDSLVKVGAGYQGEGELFGFWWNDATGWLKLNCAADTNLNSFDVANCAANGGADYGVYIDSFDATTSRAVLAGYAWSDSLGYMDFTGVQVDLPLLTPTYDARVNYVKANPGDVLANGENGYKIEVSFYDGSTNVTDEFADTNLQNSFCLAYRDRRKVDTTGNFPVNVTSSSTGRIPFYGCGDGSTQFAVEDDVQMNQLGWDASPSKTVMGRSANRFTYNSTKNVFESIVTISSRIPVEQGQFDLVQVFMYNDISGLYKEDNDPTVNGALTFQPPYDLSILGGENVTRQTCRDGDLVLEFDSPMPASICGEFYGGGGIGNLSVGIVGQPSVNSLYDSKFDSITATIDQEGSRPFQNQLLASQNGYESTGFWLTVDLADGVTINEMEPLKPILDLAITSSVSYRLPTGATVRRFGPELSNDSQNIFELNIQGGLVDRSFGSTTFSSGSKDTQGANQGIQVKERVYRVLRNIIQMNPKPGNCGNLEFSKVERSEMIGLLKGCNRVSKSGERHVVFIGARSTKEGPGGYVRLSEIQSLLNDQVSDEGKAPVIVMYGVDFILDQNIVPSSFSSALGVGTDISAMESELNDVPGFVVLESDLGQGGEVIVSANVTDVVSYIYSDGRLLSAPDAANAVAAAEGDADNILNRSIIDESTLYNQFSLVGALYSGNCIGCASNTPPLRADGSVSESRALSLNDDLNAFRYTPLTFDFVTKDVDVEERDAFGQPTGNTVTETYTCLVPCGENANSFEPLTSNGTLKNECRNIEDKITIENACFDSEGYISGDRELSLIEETIAGSLFQGTGATGIKQLDKVLADNPSFPNYADIRSVNIRSLGTQDDMPVFGVISQ